VLFRSPRRPSRQESEVVSPVRARREAFTLIELLVVIASSRS